MSPVRVWFGLVFVAMGVLAILDAAGVAPWTSTFDQWWPIAIVGWGVAGMLGKRRIWSDGLIVAAIGLALLADQQTWASEALVWAVLFLLVGVALLLPRARDGHDRAGEEHSIAPASQG